MNLLYVIRQNRRQLWIVFWALAGAGLAGELAFVHDYSAFAQVRAAHGSVALNEDISAAKQDFAAHVQLVQSAGFLQGMAERLTDNDRRQLVAPFSHWFGSAETAGEVLLAHRIVTPNPTAQIIDLGFTHPDPAVAARVANALAAELVRQSDQMIAEQKAKILGDLQKETDTLNRKTETLQAQLDSYVGKYGLAKLDASEANADFSSVQQLTHQAVEAKTALDKLDLQRQQIQQQVLSGQPLWGVSFIAGQPHIQDLIKNLQGFVTRLEQMRGEQYAEDSPPMVEMKGSINNTTAQLADAADVISKQVTSDYEAASTLTTSALARLEDARKQALELSTARTDYQSLLEEHDTTRKLAAAKAVALSDQTAKLNLSMTTYAVLVKAEPPTAADPPPWARFVLQAVGAGVGGSLLLALGLAFFRPPPAKEREEHERRRRRHRRFHSSTRHRDRK